MAARSERGTPGGVAIVGVLAIIVGIIQVAGGLILVIFNGDVHGYSSGTAVVFGIVTVVVGLIYLWVGRGLIALNPTALFIGLVVSGARVAFDVVWLIVYGLDGIGISGIATLIFNVLIFGALMSGRRAFESN